MKVAGNNMKTWSVLTEDVMAYLNIIHLNIEGNVK
jgi:hypothetical protein